LSVHSAIPAFTVGILLACAGCSDNQSRSTPPAAVQLTQLSTDTFVNSTSQHATEVNPASFAYGPTVITTFEVGLIFEGSTAADIGYAVSNDNGLSWQSGVLPGITIFQGAGANSAVSDPSVIFDAKHGEWLIASLGISSSNHQVLVSQSSDRGASWGNPIAVSQGSFLDQPWITCDNSSTSPHYGNCYMEWDDDAAVDQVWMSTSSDGGLTWASPIAPASANGFGGQPLAQPNGTVIVPFLSPSFDIAASPTSIQSFSSSDGGASWTGAILVSTVSVYDVAGGLSLSLLPSAGIDAGGNIYVVWADCSFRPGCSSNDLVMSTSSDGTHWSSPSRIPADDIASTIDHFIPGLGVDSTTSGNTAHLGVTYYYYPVANCTASSCALYVGFISSSDGGNTWSSSTPVAGPMSLSWLPSSVSNNVGQGQTVSDYITTSFSGGKAYGFFALAKPKSGSAFNEAIYTTQSGFDVNVERRGQEYPRQTSP
jgi:hypothetical protein